MPAVDRIEVLGVPIGAFTMRTLIARMEEMIAQPGSWRCVPLRKPTAG